jgi:hypothetical protein
VNASASPSLTSQPFRSLPSTEHTARVRPYLSSPRGVFTLPLAAYSQTQDMNTERQRQQPAANESSQPSGAKQPPMAQQKGAEPGHAGRSAAEQAQPGTEMRGNKSQNQGAQEEQKSKKPETKHPAQKAEEEKPAPAPMQKPGTSSERIKPGKEKMQAGEENIEKRQPGEEKAQKQGQAKPGPAATESERAPRQTMRPNTAPSENPGTEATVVPRHVSARYGA